MAIHHEFLLTSTKSPEAETTYLVQFFEQSWFDYLLSEAYSKFVLLPSVAAATQKLDVLDRRLRRWRGVKPDPRRMPLSARQDCRAYDLSQRNRIDLHAVELTPQESARLGHKVKVG